MVPGNDGDRWRDRLYYPVSDLGFVGEVNAMKKRISVFLTVILLCLACAFPVWAETESRLADQAGLLDTDQKESLCNTLDEQEPLTVEEATRTYQAGNTVVSFLGGQHHDLSGLHGLQRSRKLL